jgi:hypothetical protein
MLVVNGLANALPIAGKTTGELSDLYPSLFTPAGFTFSIWGLIYLLLIIFVIFQAKGIFSDSKLPKNRYLYRIESWFLISSLANISWILAWHYQVIWLSMLIMLVLLGSLIMIYLQLGIGQRSVSKSKKICVHIPMSVYLGWITVATIANAATVLLKYKWDGFGVSPQIWTSAMIATATLITLIMLFKRRDFFFALVIIWAFFGIFYKHFYVFGGEFPGIQYSAIGGIVVVSSGIIIQLVRAMLKGK